MAPRLLVTQSANLFERFADAAADAPQRTFVETPDGTTHTYGWLDETTARLRAVLDHHGVQRGDRVAIATEKSPLAVALYLACLRHGAVAVPLNPDYTAFETAERIADAEPALYVGPRPPPPGAAVWLTLDRERGSLVDELARHGAEPGVEPLDGAAPAAVLYTSGTTGRPKGALISHGNLSSNAAALHDAWRFSPEDVLLHVLPVYHAHGLFVALHLALLSAIPIRLHPTFDVAATLADLRQSTVFMGVPTHYRRLLAGGLDRATTSGVRLFVSGSAPLPAPVWEEFATRTGHEILERYGMTETGMITTNPYDGPRLPGTVGYPLSGVDVRLAPVRGRDDEHGVGELETRGPGVIARYWRRPDLDGELSSAWFATGDLARIDPDGRVTLVGRSRDLIISGGLNVYPAEVERELDALDGVSESAVIGVTDSDFGEAVVGVVVATRDTLDPDLLCSALRDRLAAYKVPKRIVVVDALPRNAMGKVDKAALGRATSR